MAHRSPASMLPVEMENELKSIDTRLARPALDPRFRREQEARKVTLTRALRLRRAEQA